MRPRVVYVARIGALTKVGSADLRRVSDRIRTLSSEHKVDITVVALLPGTFQSETAIVRRFERLAVPQRREYFADDGSIAAWVASLPAAHRRHIEHVYLGAAGKGPTARRAVPTIRENNCNPFVSAEAA